MTICAHPIDGDPCGKPVPAPRRRGRPARFCLEHRAPKFAKERERSGWTAQHKYDHLPDCCMDAGRRKCAQHKQARRSWWRSRRPRRDAYDPITLEPREGIYDDAAVYRDLLDAITHYTVYNQRGQHLWSADLPESADPWDA